MSRIGSPMSHMRRHFTNERFKCTDSMHRSIVDRLEVAALAAVMAENDSGGQARQVVADVARVLGVDIDDGPGHRWDPEHMARVIGAADQLCVERDEATAQAALWKALAERQDNTAPIRTELRAAERERDDLRRQLAYERLKTESLSERATDDEVEELKAVIVSQAREIARLKGESE